MGTDAFKDDSVRSPLQAPEAPANGFTGKLVVVIDDDTLVLKATEGLLKSWGFEVVTARSEAAAHDNVARFNRPPHLIICDYRLSDGETGIQVTQRLCHAWQSRIPVLFVSGDTFPGHLKTLGNGHHVLHKPVSPSELLAALDALMRRGSVV